MVTLQSKVGRMDASTLIPDFLGKVPGTRVGLFRFPFSPEGRGWVRVEEH